ncbi:MAG: hypothetical protein IT472_08945 [Thermomonas sp.]|uniref:hypothetical protein n=1 Tax=Thermomonas sp. TaxID=1971895 RepID=UPI0026294DB9|nr:hypothetical protein [Thermomonas sp.]MCC7097292.1 hypothetical protein [Thermomonas sp.]
MRKHREVMDYALRHGLSLRDAERRMARERHLAAEARLAARATPASPPAAPEHAPWMLRD